MPKMTIANQVQLAWIALVILLTLIILSILGERTLPLFSGDRILAARFYKAFYIFFGSTVAGLSAPYLISKFNENLKSIIISNGSSKNKIYSMIAEGQIDSIAHSIGFMFMIICIVIGIYFSIHFWIKGS